MVGAKRKQGVNVKELKRERVKQKGGRLYREEIRQVKSQTRLMMRIAHINTF